MADAGLSLTTPNRPLADVCREQLLHMSQAGPNAMDAPMQPPHVIYRRPSLAMATIRT